MKASALTDSVVEMTTLATHLNEVGLSGTRSHKSYHKYYSKVGSSKSIAASEELTTRQKELSFQKGSKKDSEATGTSFQFDMLAQLANVPTRITLHELLCLSKTKETHYGRC